MNQTSVVEDDEIALLPVVCVHQLGCDAGPLQAIDDLAHLLQVVNDFAAAQVQLADCRRVDLQRQAVVLRVAPAHGQDLDLVLLYFGELVQRHFFALRDEAQAVRAGLCAAHPHVGMRCILDFCVEDELLVVGGEEVVHCVARHKCRRAQRHRHLLARVFVSDCLRAAARDPVREERRGHRRSQPVQRRVNMPSVETGEVQIVLFRYNCGVERLVVWVSQLDILQPFVLLDEAISNDLDLRLVWDRLEIRVQDGSFCVERLAVAV